MKIRLKALFGMILMVVLIMPAMAQDGELQYEVTTRSEIEEYSPVTDEMLANPDPGDWIMYRQNYASWGYSPLEQINRENVGELELVWSRAVDPGINENTTMVHDGIMFIPHGGSTVTAVDATTGDMIWEYRAEVPESHGRGGYSQSMRSLGFYGTNVYVITWDNYLVALDAPTGQVVWVTDRGNNQEESSSTGPFIMDGTIVAGCTVSGDIAGGCPVVAYDAVNGEELWRFYPVPRPGEPGDESWNDAPLDYRNRTAPWGGFSYDPELNLFYWGAAAVGPSSPTVGGRGDGAALFTNTRFATDPREGIVFNDDLTLATPGWWHQIHPYAAWDMECTFEAILVDTVINPDPDSVLAANPNIDPTEVRKVQTGMPCKTGVIWTFDRETGEFLYAKETTYQNYYNSVDPETGTVEVNEETIAREVGVTYTNCPSWSGGRNWHPGSYSPLTNAFYISQINACQDYQTAPDPGPLGGYNTTGTTRYEAPPTHHTEGMIGRIDAVNIETGETMWTYEQRAVPYAPVLSTGGHLLFMGDNDRRMRALDDETGEVLWETILPSSVSGHQMSYEVDGRQYIAVSTGGSNQGAFLTRQLAPELDPVVGSNAVFVFALPAE